MSELKEYLCIEAKTIECKDSHGYRFTFATKSAPVACMESVYLKSEADKVIAEKDKEIAELRRALWRARAERARTEQCYENYSFYVHRHQKTMYGGTYRPYIAWLEKWIEVERKCRSKAEKFGG